MNQNKKLIKIIAIAIVIIAVGYALTKPAINPVAKMIQLNHTAQQKADELNKITIVTGMQTNAVKQVDGDMLTASSDAHKSTFAVARMTVNKNFGQLYSDVASNLKNAGYTAEGSPENPYYNTASNGPKFNTINIRYASGTKSLLLSYVLDKTYTCTYGNVCKLGSDTPIDQITASVPSSFSTYTVTEIDVTYTR